MRSNMRIGAKVMQNAAHRAGRQVKVDRDLKCCPLQTGLVSHHSALVFGTDGGGRTHTVSLPLDFESSASANSATSASPRTRPRDGTTSLSLTRHPLFAKRIP